MWPKDGANILAFNNKENRLLYKRYSNDGILWPAHSGFGATSEGRWDENTEIIGVELDYCLYNGLCLTGDSYSTAEFAKDPNYTPPESPMPKMTRRAFELVSPQKKSKKKVSNAA